MRTSWLVGVRHFDVWFGLVCWLFELMDVKILWMMRRMLDERRRYLFI